MIVKICGFNGAGKTELASMIVHDIMLDQIKNGCVETEQAIERLNNGGLSNFLPAKHYVYCNWDVKVVYKNVEYHSWLLNPYDIGLFNAFHKIKFFPPGSYIFIDESKDYFNKKNFSSFPDFLLNFLTTHRHNDLKIFLISPNSDDDDIEIRRLISDVYQVKYSINKYLFPFIFKKKLLRKSIIYYNHYFGRNCIENAINSIEPVSRVGQKYLRRTGQQLPNVFTEKKVFHGNIFEHYYSFDHRWRFYVGATAHSTFCYENASTIGLTLKDLSKHVFDNSFTIPVSWYKATIKEKKNVNDELIFLNPFAVAYKRMPISITNNNVIYYTNRFRKLKNHYLKQFFS